jgi:uncharacterized repeat protein (TIGR04076 family)
MPETIRVRVSAIDGVCDVHKVGDTFYIRDAALDAKVPVCVHALPSLLHYAMMMREGADPVDIGLARAGPVGRVACPDPGPPLTNGGCAIFDMELIGRQGVRARHTYVDR